MQWKLFTRKTDFIRGLYCTCFRSHRVLQTGRSVAESDTVQLTWPGSGFSTRSLIFFYRLPCDVYFRSMPDFQRSWCQHLLRLDSFPRLSLGGVGRLFCVMMTCPRARDILNKAIVDIRLRPDAALGELLRVDVVLASPSSGWWWNSMTSSANRKYTWRI